MKALVFRQAHHGDGLTIAGLLEDLGYPQDVPRFKTILEQALEDKGLDIILALSEERSVGLLSLRTAISLRLSGLVVSIEELVVAPEARGKKLGTNLVELAKEKTRHSGAVLLEVHTSMSRESFKRSFYLKNGFARTESCVLRWMPRVKTLEEQNSDAAADDPRERQHL